MSIEASFTTIGWNYTSKAMHKGNYGATATFLSRTSHRKVRNTVHLGPPSQISDMSLQLSSLYLAHVSSLPFSLSTEFSRLFTPFSV